MNDTMVVLLHEIYGINSFIKEIEGRIQQFPADTLCVDLNEQRVFSYEQTEEAYGWYMKCAGFRKIDDLTEKISHLRKQYKKIYVLGFSVGATNAWLLSQSAECDGVICCYGSRIRDYHAVEPRCKTLLLFAKHDSFDVENVVKELKNKKQVDVVTFPASHGFLDPYNQKYDVIYAKQAERLIKDFLLQE